MNPSSDRSLLDDKLPRKTAIFALTVTTLVACNTFLAFGGLGVAMEDAAIHLALGKGLFAEGFFSLSAGEPTGAATSPLWVLLNGIAFFITGSVHATATLLSALTVAALASGIFVLFEEEDRLLALTAAAFSMCMGPVLWHLFSGMETGAFCAAVFWTGHFLVAGRLRSASWMAAVACLLRFEGCLLVVLILGKLLLRLRREKGKMDWRLWSDGLLRPVLAVAFFMGLNLLHTGRALPSTGDAKRFLFGVYYHGSDALFEVPSRLYEMSLEWWDLFDKGLGRNGIEWAFPLLAGLSAMGLFTLIRRRSRGLYFFGAWTLLLNITYAIDLPTLEVAGRYQATNLFFFSLGLAGCVSFFVRPELTFPHWKRGFAPWRQGMALVGAMVALTVITSLSISGTRWGNGRALQIAHLDSIHQRAGLWLAKNNRDCLPVVLGEVGWIAFHTQSSEGCQPALYDYYGVTDPDYFKAVEQGRAFSTALEERGEGFFAFSLLGTGFHGVHLRVRWLEAPPGLWEPGGSYTALEPSTGAYFRFEVYHRFGFQGVEERGFFLPVGESTAMNPMVVGRVRRIDKN